jgi:hypothetical protein
MRLLVIPFALIYLVVFVAILCNSKKEDPSIKYQYCHYTEEKLGKKFDCFKVKRNEISFGNFKWKCCERSGSQCQE